MAKRSNRVRVRENGLGLANSEMGGVEAREAAAEAVNSRRQFLRTMSLGGAAAVVGAGSFALVDSAPALAGTTGVYWDQGGAVFNVMAYGATGDGTTDDTTSIQNAINAAQAAHGGVVYFPTGTFLVSSTLSISGTNKDGVSLVGSGMGASTILAKSTFTSGDIIHFSQAKYPRVENLAISSVNARTSGAAINLEGYPSGNGLDITVATDGVVQNVWLDNVFNGIYVNGSTNVFLIYIDRVYITTIAKDGVGIWIYTPGGESCFVSNVFINGGKLNDTANRPLAAVRVQQTGDFTLRSVSVIECNNGLLIDPPSGAAVVAGLIEACLWDTCNQGVTVDVPSGGEVHALSFVGNWCSFHEANGFYIAGNASHITLTGCRLVDSKGYGFIANGGGAQRIFIDGCDASGNDRTPNSYGGVAGIAFAQETGQFSITDCNVDGLWTYQEDHTQTYGIRIFAGCDYYVIANNIVMNNTTGPQIIEPGAAHSIVKDNLGYKNRTAGATSVADGGTITHGLDGTPTRVRATPSVAGQMVSVTALGATTFTCAIKKPDGTAGTTQTIYWEAEF